MPGYWWECPHCGAQSDFPKVTATQSVGAFLRDCLFPSGWDQTLLTVPCPCGNGGMRITYDFPGKKKEVLRVIRIVGIQWTIEHLMMMWETSPDRTLKERWFDFKYLRGLNPLGLNRPAVFPQAILKQVFALYREKADIVDFP